MLKKTNLTLYTIMHFLVDLSCIFYLMGMIYIRLPNVADTLKAAVIYNMFAFALPMFLGFVVDIIGRNALFSAAGCFLIMLAFVTVPPPWTGVALIGIGNGLFHIGGGRQILQDSKGRYAPSGIFIASGAIGVYLGKSMSMGFRQIYFNSMWILLALSVIVLSVLAVKQWKYNIRSFIAGQRISSGVILLSLFIFIVVIIRSYYGFLTAYSWNNGFVIGLIFTGCVFAGKFMGGIAADLLGVLPTSVISLAGAGILALWAPSSPAAGCISIMLFNMTMPITLTLLTEQWREFPGFSFGTLMMALFLGTLPPMVGRIRWLSSPAGMLILCIISMALLVLIILINKKKVE